MKVYLFGNEDLREDSLAFKAVEAPGVKVEGVEFVKVKPNEDLPFAQDNCGTDSEPSSGEDFVVIMDTVYGINEVTVFDESDLDKISALSRTSVHDFDLGFQLKYLKKLGKLKRVKIIGIPMEKEIDYFSIQSILRKLVAQDMQGS